MVGRDGGKEKYLELSSSTSYPSACSWELVEGVSVAGNINTLACMKVRSGRLAITFTASSLRCSSLFGFLSAMRKDQCINGAVLGKVIPSPGLRSAVSGQLMAFPLLAAEGQWTWLLCCP